MSQDSVASDALSELGLSGSPFTPSDYASADFISPLRENQVQRAAHLCRYGDQLLVVVGGKGAGKTFFLTKLAHDLADIEQLVVIDGAKYSESGETFWGDLLQQLAGANAASDSSVGAQIAALRKVLSQCDEPPVLLVDNADAFDDQVLAVLLSLMSTGVHEVPLKTVFAGSSRLVERLDNLNNLDVMIYDLELAIVTVEQWQNFCDIQLRLHGLSGASPISDDAIEAIINDAGINVRKIFDRLDDQLREVNVTSLPSKGNLGLPPMHVALIVGLVAILVLVVLLGERLWGGDDNAEVPVFDKDTEVVVFDSAAPPPESAVQELYANANAPAAADSTSVNRAADTVSAAIAELDAAAAEAASQAASTPDVKLNGADLDVANLDEADLDAAEVAESVGANAPVLTLPEAAAEIGQAATTQSGVTEPSVSQPSASESSVSQPEVVVEAASAPKGTAIASSSPSSAATTSAFDLADGRYVLQIMASSNSQALNDFVVKQPNRASLRIVNIERSGADWYVLVQGDYASPEAARAGLRKLPKSQQRDGVWPRKTDDLRQLLRKDR